MSTDLSLERRLHDLYAVPVPGALDRQVATVVASAPVPARRSGRIRPRRIAILGIAAVLVTVAAGPAATWFAGWDPYSDRLWELATPVERMATDDGYEVTVHRAYADALGVRLAMSVLDLEGRWSEMRIDAADVTDADGRAYPGWNWSWSDTAPTSGDATWSRFILPSDAPDDLDLRVTVTALAVRAPEPLALPLEPERIWTSVGGDWALDVEVPVSAGLDVLEPAVSASHDGVTITWESLELVPSGPIARLTVRGLPELPAGSAHGWYPVLSAELDGQELSDDVFPSGILADGDEVIFEAIPYLDIPGIEGNQHVDDLTGHWEIKIDGFWSSDPTHDGFGMDLGPWVLEFDVPPEKGP